MSKRQPDVENPADGTYQAINDALTELRPFLRADGGDCELVGVDGNVVSVRMIGACAACQFAGATLGRVQERLSAAVGRPLRVASVPFGR